MSDVLATPFVFSAATLPLTILLAYGLDLLLGDHESWPHPVRLMGFLAKKTERFLYPTPLAPARAFIAGAALSVFLPLLSAFLLAALLRIIFQISPWLFFLIRLILCWQLLAVKNLADEARAVMDCLRKDGLSVARRRLSRIVGRDTESLGEAEIVKATVETVAENFNDGICAPLLYLMLGDLPLLFYYKFINTLDSLIGYRSLRYEYFGKAAARLDDFFNYLPARLAALQLLLASVILRMEPREAWRIFRRDRSRHRSPNSGQTESVMAGALGIQLGGTHSYGGVDIVKPEIGDAGKKAEAKDIERSVCLMYCASSLTVFLMVLLAWLRGRFCF